MAVVFMTILGLTCVVASDGVPESWFVFGAFQAFGLMLQVLHNLWRQSEHLRGR